MDTGGSPRIGTSATQIRAKLRKLISAHSAGQRQPAYGTQKPTGVTTGSLAGKADAMSASAKELVWIPLQQGRLLEPAFMCEELIAYLKLMAEFIETALNDGMSGVERKFDVDSETLFLMLVKRIRERVPTERATEFHGPANRAFQIGSNRWAAKLLNKTNPTEFKVREVVEALGKHRESAHLLSASFILEDYGKRLLEAPLPGGKSTAQVAGDIDDSYRKQLQEFMDHSNGSQWVSGMIEATVRKLPDFLLK